jgi:hypothetical protein
LRVGITGRVEGELPGELGRGGEFVGTGDERQTAEILSRQVVTGRNRLTGRDVIGSRDVALCLAGDGVVVVGGPVDDGREPEAGERGAGSDPEITVEYRRPSVGDSGASEDREGDPPSLEPVTGVTTAR